MGIIYRLEAAESNELLYVGLTFRVNLSHRLQEHEQTLRKHGYDGRVNVRCMTLQSVKDTEDAEQWLIRSEAPLWNVTHNVGLSNVFSLNPDFHFPEWQEWEHSFENFRYLGDRKPVPPYKRKRKGVTRSE